MSTHFSFSRAMFFVKMKALISIAPSGWTVEWIEMGGSVERRARPQVYFGGNERPTPRLQRLKGAAPLLDLEVDRASRTLQSARCRRRENLEQIRLLEAVMQDGSYSAKLAEEVSTSLGLAGRPRRRRGRPLRDDAPLSMSIRETVEMMVTGSWSPPVVSVRPVRWSPPVVTALSDPNGCE
jgi:hypothetical protein